MGLPGQLWRGVRHHHRRRSDGRAACAGEPADLAPDAAKEGTRMTVVSADAIRAETITITGHGGDEIEAYRAVPLAPGSRGGVVWIHHMPGYDREPKEFVRRLA